MSIQRPESMNIPMVTVKYIAEDGTVFEQQTVYYLIQEVLMNFARLAYEQGTAMERIEIF